MDHKRVEQGIWTQENRFKTVNEKSITSIFCRVCVNTKARYPASSFRGDVRMPTEGSLRLPAALLRRRAGAFGQKAAQVRDAVLGFGVGGEVFKWIAGLFERGQFFKNGKCGLPVEAGGDEIGRAHV